MSTRKICVIGVGMLLSFLSCLHIVLAASGTFSGNVKAEWLDDGRKMKLLEDFHYIDSKGTKWDAPKDWIIDGATIPTIAWSFAGGPFSGKYRKASVIHDVACDRKERHWWDVHEAFYNAMIDASVGIVDAQIKYAAVHYWGPRWPIKYSYIQTIYGQGTAQMSLGEESKKENVDRLVSDADLEWMRNDALRDHIRSTTMFYGTGWEHTVVSHEIKGSEPNAYVEVNIKAVPLQSSISENEFSSLVGLIRSRASNSDGPMSLFEIRKYNDSFK